MAKPRWHSFEHQVLRDLREHQVPIGLWIIAVSGGEDSMVLLHCLSRLQSVLNWDLHVVFVHHGGGGLYRDQAAQFVEKESNARGLSFSLLGPAATNLTSESEMRLFRWKALKEFAIQRGAQGVAFGHHAQDLLETRLLRLIRGTTSKGLEAISLCREWRLRPLLLRSKSEIQSYRQDLSLHCLEDPSNHDLGILRNWLRHQWLPELEARQPGSLKAMARSLSSLAGQTKQSVKLDVWTEEGIHRSQFSRMNAETQKKVIFEYLAQKGILSATHTQVKEILKQLDSSKKRHIFSAASCQWTVDAERIKAQPK